jgi:Flp pilus assembly pilin Flp
MQSYEEEVPRGQQQRPPIANRRAKGSGLVEYALILVLVAVASTAALAAAGPALKDVYCDAIEVLDPNWQDCPAPEPEPEEPPAGPSIRDAVYNPDTQQAFFHVHATEDYEGEMYIQGYGAPIQMTPHGETFCFQETIAISVGDLPLSLQVGSSTHGWTTVEFTP